MSLWRRGGAWTLAILMAAILVSPAWGMPDGVTEDRVDEPLAAGDPDTPGSPATSAVTAKAGTEEMTTVAPILLGFTVIPVPVFAYLIHLVDTRYRQ